MAIQKSYSEERISKPAWCGKLGEKNFLQNSVKNILKSVNSSKQYDSECNKESIKFNNKSKSKSLFAIDQIGCDDNEGDPEFVLTPVQCKVIFDAVQKAWTGLDIKNSLTNTRSEVIAAFVMISEREPGRAIVLSIGTGNRCIHREALIDSAGTGEAVLDTHAEVVARRGLLLYLYDNLLQLQKNNFKGSNSKHLLESYTRKNGVRTFRKKPHLRLYLYLSEAPCGDAKVRLIDGLLGNKNKVNGILRVKYELKEDLTLALPSNYRFTLNGVERGQQHCVFNSCSDKILKWNVTGVQGALLSQLISEPIYLDGVVLSDGYHFERISRALYSRLDETVLESKLETNSCYGLNCPRIGHSIGTIDGYKPQVQGNVTISFNWHLSVDSKSNGYVEVIESDTGRIYTKSKAAKSSKNIFNTIFVDHFQKVRDKSNRKSHKNESVSRLSKRSLLSKHIELVKRSELLMKDDVKVDPDLLPYYLGVKKQAIAYQRAQHAFKETLQTTGLGQWSHVPLQCNLFPHRM